MSEFTDGKPSEVLFDDPRYKKTEARTVEREIVSLDDYNKLKAEKYNLELKLKCQKHEIRNLHEYRKEDGFARQLLDKNVCQRRALKLEKENEELQREIDELKIKFETAIALLKNISESTGLGAQLNKVEIRMFLKEQQDDE
jgi:predicted RNase H-like nuclease (RuvC/YqgF family)